MAASKGLAVKVCARFINSCVVLGGGGGGVATWAGFRRDCARGLESRERALIVEVELSSPSCII